MNALHSFNIIFVPEQDLFAGVFRCLYIMVSRRLLDARVVPWSSWDEWSDVERLTKSKDASGISEAQRRVSMWRLRRSVSIPIAYQALVSLRALLFSSKSCTDYDNDNYTWRLAVSMCIVRLVNGLTDRLQGARARSVKYLSTQLELPGVLVHIRHQSTHGPLPTEKQLRVAAVAAVEWIDKHYIGPQRNAVHSSGDEGEGEDEDLVEIRRVFHGDYTRTKFQATATTAIPDNGILLKVKECIERVEGNNNISKPDTNGICKTRKRNWKKKTQKWVLCTGDESKWANMPLGLCPWQSTVGTHCAELPDAADAGAALDNNDSMKIGNTTNIDIDIVNVNKNANSRGTLSAEDFMYVKKMRATLLQSGR